MHSRPYDLVIFGASGCTGGWIIEECAKLQAKESQSFTWAVAGRSRNKLAKCLRTAADFTGVDLQNVDLITADVYDFQSICSMAAQASVLVNCVGPYHLYGDAVMRACIQSGTNYIDLSAEFPFLEKMQVAYHDEAEQRGIYVVGSCAMDSIPADCGVVYLQQHFKGEVNSVVSYAEFSTRGNTQAAMGSWQSWVHILPGLLELPKIRKALYKMPMPPKKYVPFMLPIHYTSVLNSWCFLYPSPDGEVVHRSQYHFYTKENQRPVSFSTYYKPPSFLFNFGASVVGMFLIFLSLFKFGRDLLSKYPKLFSLGAATENGPCRVDADKLEMKFTLVAEGWSGLALKAKDTPNVPPDKKLMLEIEIGNGYRGSAIMAIQAAVTILREKEQMPSRGGVYPPGAAFARTSLIERCHSRGVLFKLKTV